MKFKSIYWAWLLLFLYLVGLAGLLYEPTRPLLHKLVWVQILFSFIVLISFHKKKDFIFFISLFLIGIAGFFLEVLGVNTGYIFGNYLYGPTLGYQIFNTPLMMAVNWAMTVYLSRQLAFTMVKEPIAHSLVAAILMLLMDLFLEPFAIETGMWAWSGGSIPTQNYVAWFVFGFIFNYAWFKSAKPVPNPLALPIYLIQIGFFITLYVLHRPF